MGRGVDVEVGGERGWRWVGRGVGVEVGGERGGGGWGEGDKISCIIPNMRCSDDTPLELHVVYFAICTPSSYMLSNNLDCSSAN